MNAFDLHVICVTLYQLSYRRSLTTEASVPGTFPAIRLCRHVSILRGPWRLVHTLDQLFCAAGEGFEPPVVLPTADFKAATIGLSDNPPSARGASDPLRTGTNRLLLYLVSNRRILLTDSRNFAERTGFEPACPEGRPSFQPGAIDHSATSPCVPTNKARHPALDASSTSAEDRGFEPLEVLPSPAFETGAIGRSANPPWSSNPRLGIEP